MSRSTYEPVQLDDVQLDSSATAAAAGTADVDDQPAQRQPLTKRKIYSGEYVERRTPRLPNETDEAYKRRVNSQYIQALIHSLGWVLAAAGIAYYTDMWNVVRYDQRVNHSFLVLGFTSMFVLLMVIAYLAVWVPLTAKRPVLDLSTYAPTAVPIGAAAGVATYIFFTIALWPIWGWVTIPIMTIFSFAACLGPNLIPI